MALAHVRQPQRYLTWLAAAGCAALAALAACSDSSRSTAIDASVDTAIDTPPNACLACRADQLCVASYDGLCHSLGVTCVARTVDCPNNACSSACQTAYCSPPLQCQDRAPCGGEPPTAFTCYGP